MKVGDKIIIRSNYYMRIDIISRETKNYWIVNNNKFKKSDLYLVGENWSQTKMLEFNEENYLKFIN